MVSEMDEIARTGRPRVVVLGAGFAGYHCLRRLERRLPAGAAEVIAVSPTERACSVVGVEGRRRVVRYDRLVITCGSVTRLPAVPGYTGTEVAAQGALLTQRALRH